MTGVLDARSTHEYSRHGTSKRDQSKKSMMFTRSRIFLKKTDMLFMHFVHKISARTKKKQFYGKIFNSNNRKDSIKKNRIAKIQFKKKT